MTARLRGFTLPEVMLALVISGIVLLIGRGVVSAMASAQQSLQESGLRTTRTLNRAEWLRDSFRTLDAGGDGQGSFDGRRERLAFSSRLMTSRGWAESTRIVLGVINGKLQAMLARGDTLVLDDDVDRVAFDYLLEPGELSRWVQEWQSPSTAPVAVRIRLQHDRPPQGSVTVDTLLFLVGERG